MKNKMKSKMKAKISLLLLFLLLISLSTWIVHAEAVKEIKALQATQIKYLENSYTQGLDRFNMIAKNVFEMLKKDKEFIDIFDKASTADDLQRAELRERLHRHLEPLYKRIYKLGVRQFHFILPNNRTFLRMHKPQRYDDDLTNIRYGFTYTNYIKQPISGFEEGYTAHGFRHVFPLSVHGKYLGCIDVSFSSTKLQDYIEQATKIHTHFIVNKNIFSTIAWKSNIQEKYYESIENSDYLYNMSHHINYKQLKESESSLIAPNKTFISNHLKSKLPFSFYAKDKHSNKIYIVAFYPIVNIKGNKVSAYLVSYTKSEEIAKILFKEKIILGTLFLLLSVTFIFLYRSRMQREKLEYELQHDELTSLFNKKYFFTLAQETLNKALHQESECSIVMADIDLFKRVNETYGHECGDKILKELATLLCENIGKNDILARYNGEEFILLIYANEYLTHSLMHNIQRVIDQHKFHCEKESEITITLSFGIAQFKPGSSLEETISRAYKALYHSKEQGVDSISFG